jgi:hypothetical protein
MTIPANILRIETVTAEEAGFHMLQIDHRQEWLHLVLTAATIPLRRSWIPSLLQYRVCLLHRHSITETEMAMDIAAHPVQAQMAEIMAMAMAMGAHHRGTKLMGMGAEEVLKAAAIPTARMAEGTSTTTAIPVEEEEAKIHIRMVVAQPATAITKVKVTVMVSEVEARTTTTKAMAGDEQIMSRAPKRVKIVHL